MKLKYSRLLPVLLISFSLLYNSCSIVGLGIGAAVDSSRPDPENKLVNREDYETIKRDKEITVHLKNNSSKEGRFYNVTEKYLNLKIGLDTQRINLDEIRSLEIKAGGKQGKSQGAAIGLVIDIVILIWIIREVGPCLAGAC